jgi:hypothetical protein
LPHYIAAPTHVDFSEVSFDLPLGSLATLDGAVFPGCAEHAPIERNYVIEVGDVKPADLFGAPQRLGAF